MQLSDIEKEVIALRLVMGALNDMVNHSLLRVHFNEQGTAQVGFSTIHQKQLFNILLTDFMEDVSPIFGFGAGSRTWISILKDICAKPSFNVEGDIEFVQAPLDAYDRWLNETVVVPTWLSSIDTEINLSLRREQSIRICGNISKHNPARLLITADRLSKVLAKTGLSIQPIELLPTLDDFYERFFTDIFGYHVTMIVSLLNNLRWGIHRYLWPEYLRSYRCESGEIKYHYDVPSDVTHSLAITYYWDLMNATRRDPYVPQFSVPPSLRAQY